MTRAEEAAHKPDVRGERTIGYAVERLTKTSPLSSSSPPIASA
jgi:hypothetical protein